MAAPPALYSREDKDKARQASIDFKRARNWYAAAAGAFLLMDPHATEFILVAGLIGAYAEDCSLVEDRIVADPARDDWKSRTRIQPVSFRQESLGEDSVTQAGADAARKLLDFRLRTGAMLRAVERAMGAKSADDADAYAQRLAEAGKFAGQAADAGKAFPSAIGRLHELLAAVEGPMKSTPRGSVLRSGMSLADVVTPEALALLYQAGVPVRLVRAEVERPEIEDRTAFEIFVEGSTRATSAIVGHAESLIDWAPSEPT